MIEDDLVLEVPIENNLRLPQAYINNVYKQIERDGLSLSQALILSAAYSFSYPSQREDIVQYLAQRYNHSPPKILNDLLAKEEIQSDQTRLINAANKLVPTIKTERRLEDMLPSDIARIVRASAERTNSDEISCLFCLLSVVGSRLGGHYRILSRIKEGHVPCNLNILLVANSSGGKSTVTDKFTAPLMQYHHHNKEILDREIEAIEERLSGKNDSDRRRREIRKLNANRRDAFTKSNDFTEQAAQRYVFEQAPNEGVMLFQDEAGNLLGCEQYSNGASSNNHGPFRSLIMLGQTAVLEEDILRADAEKAGSFRGQTLSILGCIQNQKLPGIINFAEDSVGFIGRFLFVQVPPEKATAYKRIPKSIDPIAEFISDRLIPFTASIKSNSIFDESSSTSYILSEFNEEDGAQEEYEHFYENIRTKVAEMKADGTEPTYAIWLDKGPVFVLKFAGIIHCLIQMHGQHASKSSDDFSFDNTYPEFRRANSLMNKPISKKALDYALQIYEEAKKNFLLASDAARVAPLLREQALEEDADRAMLDFVLKIIEINGPAKQSRLKANHKRKKGLTGAVFDSMCRTLIDRGNVRAEADKKSPILHWVKPLRG